MQFKSIHIPASEARAVKLNAGQHARVVNSEGGQVVDTWAFVVGDAHEYLSMSHSRTATYRIFFQPGDQLVSNLFNPVLTITDDTSSGVHDSLHAACSPGSYAHFDYPGNGRSCQENLTEILCEHKIELPAIPDPWNLFEETRIEQGGRLIDLRSSANAGDYVETRAEQSILLVCSACPSTIGGISGHQPVGAEIQTQLI